MYLILERCVLTLYNFKCFKLVKLLNIFFENWIFWKSQLDKSKKVKELHPLNKELIFPKLVVLKFDKSNVIKLIQL